MEQFGVHGLRVYPRSTQLRQCPPFTDVLRKLYQSQQRLLAGNSPRCPVVAAFVFYILHNLQDLGTPTPLPAGLTDSVFDRAADPDVEAATLTESPRPEVTLCAVGFGGARGSNVGARPALAPTDC